MIDARTVILIRHGDTNLNDTNPDDDLIRGWAEVPLNAQGKAQAEAVARSLIGRLPDAMVASDLARAWETAKIISQVTGLPISQVSQSFRPWHVGEFEGQPTKQAVPRIIAHAEHTPDTPLPGGESFNEFRFRFFQGLYNALDRFTGEVAIVAHHRNERLLCAWQSADWPSTGLVKIDDFNKKGAAPGTCTPYQIPMHRLATIVQMNDFAFGDGREEQYNFPLLQSA